MKTKSAALFFVFAASLALGVLLIHRAVARGDRETSGGRQSQSARPRQSLWVATVLLDDGHSFQMLSFVDVESSRDPVAVHLEQMLREQFPSAKPVSIRIEPVADTIVDKICAARTAERRL